MFTSITKERICLDHCTNLYIVTNAISLYQKVFRIIFQRNFNIINIDNSKFIAITSKTLNDNFIHHDGE